MAEKEKIIEEKLKHSGLFDFKGVYAFAHSWFADDGYGVIEEEYEEKVKGDTKEISTRWKASKNKSDYFKEEFGIGFRILRMTDVEVEIDGEKKKMNKGDLEIKIKGTLIRDRSSKFEKTGFSRFIRDVYNKYVIPSRVDAVEGEVAQKAVDFKEDMKAFLELTGKR